MICAASTNIYCYEIAIHAANSCALFVNRSASEYCQIQRYCYSLVMVAVCIDADDGARAALLVLVDGVDP